MVSTELHAALAPLTGQIDDISPVGGGSISASYRLLNRDGQRFFLKTQPADRAEVFDAEADGLAAISDCGCIAVPQPLASGVAAGQSYLLLDYLQFEGDRESAAAELGRQLAEQHRHPAREFGWPQDNYIGSTPQPNGTSHDWVDFFREQRLGFQFRLAARNGYLDSLQLLGQQLLSRLPDYFDRMPPPSLLHGDLWAGNWGALADGRPVIFDPAVYWGDREADLAMSRLFGGFPESFYAAYRQAWPLDPGFEARIDLYNLYHLLNHLNLFGPGYLSQVEQVLHRLLGR